MKPFNARCAFSGTRRARRSSTPAIRQSNTKMMFCTAPCLPFVDAPPSARSIALKNAAPRGQAVRGSKVARDDGDAGLVVKSAAVAAHDGGHQGVGGIGGYEDINRPLVPPRGQ